MRPIRSHTGLTATRTLNGETFTAVYSAATRTWTSASAAGRQSTRVLDDKGRTILRQAPGLEAVQYAYDPRGRLTIVIQGSGTEARTTRIGYDVQGYVGTMTDALGRDLAFAYDLAGRITRQTLPDGREIGYTYDPNGNVTSITPPGQPPHVFEYTPLDLEAEYMPPLVDAQDPATRYRYNRDQQLTEIIRPDGQHLDFGYDRGGRLSRLTLPEGEYRYGYQPTTGHVSAITAPEGERPLAISTTVPS
jgi:YD repeat-containing protein